MIEKKQWEEAVEKTFRKTLGKTETRTVAVIVEVVVRAKGQRPRLNRRQIAWRRGII